MKTFFRLRNQLIQAIGATLLLASCTKTDVSVAPPAPAIRTLTTTERQILSSSNDFAYQSFGAVRQGAPADNIFISPLSVSAALTMAYNGAAGTTKAAMRQTLGFNLLNDTQINESYRDLFALFGGLDQRVRFAAANSIWHGQQYQLQAPFVQKNQAYFGATIQGLTFGAPAAATTINNWVSTNTQGKIPTIIDQTTSDDVMYLVNALYFKGAWTRRFDPQQTYPGRFQHEDGTSGPASYMLLRGGGYRHYANQQLQVIDLPYGNKHFSMTFVLPQGSATLASVAAQLNAAQLNTWLTAADSTRALDLHVPKFRFEYEKELSQTLAQLGMGEAFTGQANFSQMVAGISSGLAITQVKHKTFLEVNEEGTEAAAATAVGIGVTSVPPSVRIDRPFIFLIREKTSNAVLFIGQVTQP